MKKGWRVIRMWVVCAGAAALVALGAAETRAQSEGAGAGSGTAGAATEQRPAEQRPAPAQSPSAPSNAARSASPAPASASSGAVPSGRAARNVAIISIHGEIDRFTPTSVQRRIEAAERAGADALVFEIDSPGGDMYATLVTASAIKGCKTRNTVAWVRPSAYSGGAIIALACREMVVTDAATIGDAMPIQVHPVFGLNALPDAEREKILGPLLVDVVDSARRNGYDEMLVQGFVRRGAELWLVEDPRTGDRVFVDHDQFVLAVGHEPDRTETPVVPSVTGGAGKAPLRRPAGGAGGGGAGAAAGAGNGGFVPAAPDMSSELINEVNQGLALAAQGPGGTAKASSRPDFTSAEHAGKWRAVEYVADGHGLIVLKTTDLLRYGMAQQTVNSEGDIQAYFGAQSVKRFDVSWSEKFAAFMTHPIIRGLLIVLLIVCLALELSHPGATVFGAIALVTLLALVVPPLMVNMASWWEVLAIVLGLVCLALEVFVIPGFGVAGVLGLVLLFGGLIGTFVSQGSSIFPNTPQQTRELTWGVSTVVVSFMVAGVALFFIWRSLPSLPVMRRLVLQETSGSTSEGLLAVMAAGETVKVGDEGVALSPLRPAGRAQFGERVIDVHVDTGMVGPGARVRVIRLEGLRTLVEKV